MEGGSLEPRVVVDDGSEVGFLQAGFNRMVSGLRERERLRDLFGRHVGQDVARRAIDPVNEAARLAELAKDHARRIVASETIVARAGIGESARWQLAEAVLLRGRTRPTRLAMPAAGAAG